MTDDNQFSPEMPTEPQKTGFPSGEAHESPLAPPADATPLTSAAPDPVQQPWTTGSSPLPESDESHPAHWLTGQEPTQSQHSGLGNKGQTAHLVSSDSPNQPNEASLPSWFTTAPPAPPASSEEPSVPLGWGPDAHAPGQYPPAPQQQPGFQQQVPTQPNPFWEEVKSLPHLLMLIVKSEPLQASREAASKKYMWIIGNVFAVLCFALLVVNTLAGGLGTASRMSPFYLGTAYRMSVGAAFEVFFILILFIAGIIVIRILMVMAVLAVRRVPHAFTTVGSLVAVSYLPQATLSLIFTVFALVPNSGLTVPMSFLYMFLFFPISMVTEILLYMNINLQAKFDKSPLVPHFLLTACWCVGVVLFTGLFVGVLSGI